MFDSKAKKAMPYHLSWMQSVTARSAIKGWVSFPLIAMTGLVYGQQSPYPGVNALPAAYSNEQAANPYQTPQTIEASEEFFQPGRIVAMVGEEPILAGELMNLIEPMLVEAKGKASKEEIARARERLMRQALVSTVQTKMLSQKFIQKIVNNKPVAERKDARGQIRMQINKVFYESYIPEMIKEKKLSNEIELDQFYRSQGTSLEGQKLTFMDSMLANEMMREITPKTVNIDILAVRDQYESEIEDWQRPPRARFQLMTVLFRKFESKEQAYSEITSMYEEVRLGGAPFESVAKRRSQGPRAEDGGVFDWTTEGSLRSDEINQTVFSIPENRLSNIFEDSDGYHAIVVLEREAARIVPFSEAYEEIRKKLEEKKKTEIRDQFLEKLKASTQVWTAWPEDLKGSRHIDELIDPNASR